MRLLPSSFECSFPKASRPGCAVYTTMNITWDKVNPVHRLTLRMTSISTDNTIRIFGSMRRMPCIMSSASPRTLQAYDPAGAATYAERAEAYLAQLRDLDSWFFEQMERIPPANRRLVAYHDAFGYLADRYGLQWIGAVVPNPERVAISARIGRSGAADT